MSLIHALDAITPFMAQKKISGHLKQDRVAWLAWLSG